jgi:hypothetical protein
MPEDDAKQTLFDTSLERRHCTGECARRIIWHWWVDKFGSYLLIFATIKTAIRLIALLDHPSSAPVEWAFLLPTSIHALNKCTAQS